MDRVTRKVLVSVVSWEERFLVGLERLLEREEPGTVILFYYDTGGEETGRVCGQASGICRDAGCDVREVMLQYWDPATSWQVIRDTAEMIGAQQTEAIVDITTMPREAIWAILLLLESEGVRVRYAYHVPESYGRWLSRDPGTPRMGLKLAGEMRFGMATMLVVLTGFDPERTIQLVRTFDPKDIQLGMQVGSQFENQERNVKRHEDAFRRDGEVCAVSRFDVDAYSGDHGFAKIVASLEDHVGKRNVVMACLGPKLAAIALYRVHRLYPDTGLVYTPSWEFNPEYSVGIRETIIRTLP